MDFGEAIPLPLDTADGFTVGRDDLTPPPGGIGLKKVIKWSEAQNGAEWHKSYILCRFVCLLSFCAFLLTLI